MRVKLLLFALVAGVFGSTWFGSTWIDAAPVDKVASQIASQSPAILVVGDSLSAGYGIDIQTGWVALLERRLRAQGYGHRVINASVSGETSAGARARLTKLLELHHPAVLILEIGANDGLRGLPVKQMRENLVFMANQAKAAGARIVIAGMQVPPNYGVRYTQDFAAAFRDIAREQKSALIPFFLDGVALDMKLVQADGLHPTAAAQPRLLENVWKELKPLLGKPSSVASR